jgi:Uma2 family endonuclease
MSTVLPQPEIGSDAKQAFASDVWRFSIDQYHAMIAAGILHSGDPVEFLEGVLVPKMTRNPRHRIALAHLREALVKLIGSDWHVESQEAVTLDTSEPEPDIAIVRGRVDDYPERHPGPAEIGLLAEVSDSSLPIDRMVKKRIYARAGIPEYWIVNLVDRQIEVYSEPTGQTDAPDYRQRSVYTSGQAVPFRLNGIDLGAVSVSEVLPR